MNVVAVPSSFDYRTIEEFLSRIPEGDEGPVLVDARHLRWIDPNGMLYLLVAGKVIGQRTGTRPVLELPESAEVRAYLHRMHFQASAREVFEGAFRAGRAQSGESEVLLEITEIAENDHVHAVVDHLQARAGAVLQRTLGYPASAVVQFSVLLSELCGNVLEHAESPGWVSAQSYNWAKRLGRHVVVIAVADVGRGFRASLADEHAARFGDRWGDATALEAAFLHGVTRFPDSGRGQGIQQIRKQVRRWDGRIAIRSGTARIADVPAWDDAPPLEEGLPFLPGAQIEIILPARDPAEGGR